MSAAERSGKPVKAMDLRQIADMGEEPKVAEKPQLVPREQTWNVSYTAPDGESHEGVIVSRILDADERLKVSRIRAGLTGGKTWETFAQMDQFRMSALAICAVQLRDVPDWVDRWAGQDDVLLYTLFGKAQEHDELFFSGGGESEGDTGVSRVVVAPILSSSPGTQ